MRKAGLWQGWKILQSWATTGVYECTNNKLLWDFKIQTDNKVEHNKPDIVVLDKTERKCMIIDVTCPFDIRVKDKEKEKIENYQDLKRELKRIWNCAE